jgi:hypothetical protein
VFGYQFNSSTGSPLDSEGLSGTLHTFYPIIPNTVSWSYIIALISKPQVWRSGRHHDILGVKCDRTVCCRMGVSQDFDSILLEIGNFGRYQILQYALISFAIIFYGALSIAYVFTVGYVPHR